MTTAVESADSAGDIRNTSFIYNHPTEDSMKSTNSTFSQRNLRLAIISALAMSTLGAASLASAAANTENLLVSASVAASCAIVTAPLAFGAYDPTAGSDLTGDGSVSVLCTNGTPAVITLGQGLAAVGDVPGAPVRQMSGGAGAAGRLGYFLYTDEAHTDPWGNTSLTGVGLTGDGLTAALTTVHGAITAGQNVPVGTYADTVIATVTF
jgi:spore coat protein U-like protein